VMMKGSVRAAKAGGSSATVNSEMLSRDGL
jgi:hypothetical protein